MDHEILEHIIDGRQKPTDLSFALLKDITANFSDGREIGHGGFATVYQGVLPNGKTVAVKRIRSNHSISETLFRREVDTLLNIEHENVVRFLGFCASTNQTAIKIEGLKEHIYAEVRERLLCFDYISNGSLQKYITDELRGLEWNTRYEIIRGICEGLYHLHKEKQIYHMDMKPENILLDNDMVPKITDFGLSRLDEKSQTMSADRLGSLGYCAPEYISEGIMSFKSDMYSLGKIIIELVTGGKAIFNNSNNVLRRWRHRWKKSGKETPLVYQQVTKCIGIGLRCQEHEPSKRPFIWDIINDIRQMEVVNEEISNANEYTFGQISSYSEEDDLLGIEPLKLHFSFALDKQMSCELELTNGTDSYIAFNVQNMSPLSYITQPQKDIMPPQSKCNVEITLQAQGKVPRDMQRANEFVVLSTKVNDGLSVEDISTNMFTKGAVNVVDEVNLDVVFDASEPEEASDKTSEKIQPLIQVIDDAYQINGFIRCMDANQTEPLIITGCSSGVVNIWNYDTQEAISLMTKVSEKQVRSVKFIARKRWFVALSCDCFVHVYKYERKVEKITSFKAHDLPVVSCSLAVHPTQPYVLSGCHTQIKLWDWDQGWNCIQTFQEHSKDVLDVTFNPEADTNSFASASDDGTVKIWSLDSPESKYTLSGHRASVNSVYFFTRDGQPYLITCSWDSTAKIWDMQKRKCVHILQHHTPAVLSVVSHPNLPILITGARDGTAHVWSSTNFRLKRILDICVSSPVYRVASLMAPGGFAVAYMCGLSVIHVGDEEQDGSKSKNDTVTVSQYFAGNRIFHSQFCSEHSHERHKICF